MIHPTLSRRFINSLKLRCQAELRILLLGAVALTTIYPLASHAKAPPQDNREPAFQERYPRYKLRPADVLELNFPYTPEFNQAVTVQPDGYINLRGLGDFRVQDKTVPEVKAMAHNAYAKILKDPVITVELKEFEKPYFVVGGEVQRPGKFDLRGDTTVMQAITVAGGFSDKSKTSEVLLFRRVSDDFAEVKRVDLRRMLRGRDLSEDLHLLPGDMILVPKSTMAKLSRFIPIPTMGMYFNPIPF